jgi:hypothetical protein
MKSFATDCRTLSLGKNVTLDAQELLKGFVQRLLEPKTLHQCHRQRQLVQMVCDSHCHPVINETKC